MNHVIEIAWRRRYSERGVSAGHNSYSMHYQGECLGDADTPMCSAARILLERGLARPEDTISTARDGIVCLSAGVRWAADHTVIENEKIGPVWAKYRPYNPTAPQGAETAIPAMT